MIDNPIEMKKNEHGVEYELPDEIALGISSQGKDLIKLKYIVLVSAYFS
jgi:hypothetical protein